MKGENEKTLDPRIRRSIFEKGERNSQEDGEWGLNKGCLHEKNELTDYLT